MSKPDYEECLNAANQLANKCIRLDDRQINFRQPDQTEKHHKSDISTRKVKHSSNIANAHKCQSIFCVSLIWYVFPILQSRNGSEIKKHDTMSNFSRPESTVSVATISLDPTGKISHLLSLEYKLFYSLRPNVMFAFERESPNKLHQARI